MRDEEIAIDVTYHNRIALPVNPINIPAPAQLTFPRES